MFPENNFLFVHKFSCNCISAWSGYCSAPGTVPPPCTGTCVVSGVDTFCWVVDSLYFDYTNATLWSKSMFKFGYFEIKFRMPNYTPTIYNRFTPTFWLWYTNSTTNWSEIDVYEIDGTKSTANFTNNIHIDTTGVDSLLWSWPMIPQFLPSITLSNWHTAAINWGPGYIDFYLDSNLIRQVRNDSLQLLIDMPMVIDNGIPSSNFCYGPIDDINTTFPVTYEIDYVKVWQPKTDCNNDQVYCNVTQASFVSKIYKSLTLGGAGCSATFNNNSSGISAIGNNYVLLDEGFEAGANLIMLIDCQPYCTEGLNYDPNQNFAPSPPPRFYGDYIKVKNSTQ